MIEGFAVRCDGHLLTSSHGFFLTAEASEPTAHGRREVLTYAGSGLEATLVIERYDDGVAAASVEIVNRHKAMVVIDRIDSYYVSVPAADWVLLSYDSGWGKEFAPAQYRPVAAEVAVVLESRAGRSSNAKMPVFSMTGAAGEVLLASIAWSGNWIARFEPSRDGLLLSGGLSDWNFAVSVAPGGRVHAPEVVWRYCESGTVDDAARAMTRMTSRHWIPRCELLDSMPVEWNHWWPYEDRRISEQVFRANVDVAASLGIDICTLDAGWFGDARGGHGWWELQGDWTDVNTERFPSGLAALGDYVHGKGMKFGVWCEIEAAGIHAKLRSGRPDLMAERDGQSLAYVCMGCPEAVVWAYGILDDLIARCHADWLKIDFNLDPGAGCNRTDHGHQAGDGLYRHYHGLYGLFDRIRAAHPNVVLESCSSGGLRIDLGILRHTHVTFLSDPDYTPHALQVMWGALDTIPARACLKFAWSQNMLGDGNIEQEPITADMPMHRFDYMVRAAMLGQFGCSYRLPDLPQRIRERFAHHIALYKASLAQFVRDGDVYRLTGAPLRDGSGERFVAFQYLTQDRTCGVLSLFRLVGAAETATVHLAGLDPERVYRVSCEDGAWESSSDDSARSAVRLGSDLMERGIRVSGMPAESSELIFLSTLDSLPTHALSGEPLNLQWRSPL